MNLFADPPEPGRTSYTFEQLAAYAKIAGKKIRYRKRWAKSKEFAVDADGMIVSPGERNATSVCTGLFCEDIPRWDRHPDYERRARENYMRSLSTIDDESIRQRYTPKGSAP